MIVEDKKMKADLLFKECTEKHWDFETLARYVLVQRVKKKKECYEGYSPRESEGSRLDD